MILLIGFFSQCSAASANGLSTIHGSSEADQKIYAELSGAVTDHIRANPMYMYDDAKFTEVAYQVYDLGSLSERYESGSTQSLTPEAQKQIRDLQKHIRRLAKDRYSLAVARTLFITYPNGELTFDEALAQERALFKEKHGANVSEDEFKKKSLVLHYQREAQEITSKPKANTEWTYEAFASAKIKEAKDAGFAKVLSGEAIKLSQLLSEKKVRTYTDKEGHKVAHDTYFTKLYGHKPEVYKKYFSDRLSDLIYEYIDKGLSVSGLSSLRSRIMGEWKKAAGDLSKLKETGFAFKETPPATGSYQETSPSIATNLPKGVEPTTTPVAVDEAMNPVEEVEDAANSLIDETKKKLDKIKLPKIKW